MTLPLTLPQLVVDVEGIPVQQGSMIAVVRNGRAYVVPDNSSALRAWRRQVTAQVKARMQATGWTTVDCPVDVTILFLLPRPAAAGKRRRPHVRPDLDKLIRAVLDSLTGTAVVDDARVVTIHAEKRYAVERCGARITVEACP